MKQFDLILHHDDLDGAAAAAAILYANWHLHSDVTTLALPIRYGEDARTVIQDSPEVTALEKDEKATLRTVYIVDWSQQGGGGMAAIQKALHDKTLIWIEHHAAAIAANKDVKIAGVQASARPEGAPVAACELAWEWVWEQAGCEDVYVPAWLTLIGDWDTWRHAKQSNSAAPDVKRYFDQFPIREMVQKVVKLFQQTVKVRMDRNGVPTLQPRSPEEANQVLRDIVDGGKALAPFERTQDAELMRARAFEGTLDGIPAILANQEFRGSGRFASVYDRKKHKLMVGFALDNTGVWAVSLYSEDPTIDCGILCERLGREGPYKSGGGHRGTGGFQTDWEHLQSLIRRADGHKLR